MAERIAVLRSHRGTALTSLRLIGNHLPTAYW